VQKLNQVYIKSVVKKALEEDLRPRGDITTSLINSKNKIIKAKIIAKQDGIIAGLDFCKTAFKCVGREAIFSKKVLDGKKIKKNKLIAEIKAKAKTILTAERTALNFLNHASGIATITNQFVKKIITVEIENINQLKQVMGLKFKRILFDNMSSSQLKRCIKLCKNKYQTEYSGNATLKNIKQISKTGVNRISVGAITHSAKSFDTSLLFR